MNNKENVTPANPKISGSIWRAPQGTTIPTDSTSDLDTKFKSLGYVSEEGVTNPNSPTYENVKAWGGSIIYSYLSDRPDTFKFILYEALNDEVLKTVYGDSRVTGSIDTSGIKVSVGAEQDEGHPYVIDMVLKAGILKRIVIPDGIVTSIGDISYKGNGLIGYEVTITCNSDSESNTHYEYISKKSSM